MTGKSGVRQAEDIGGQELSYAEVKAIASGNPAVLTLAETDAEIQRLSILKKNHADEQFLIRRRLRDLPDDIKRMSKRATGLATDMATLTATPGAKRHHRQTDILRRRCGGHASPTGSAICRWSTKPDTSTWGAIAA